MVLKKLGIHIQNVNLDTYITHNNSKWVLDLNVKCKTIKHIENNKGENLNDFGYGDGFLDITLKLLHIQKISDKNELH